MTFTSITSHTFFLMKDLGMKAQAYEIKKDAKIHGTIFKELKSKRTHIIIVKLETPIEGFRFAKINRWEFMID